MNTPTADDVRYMARALALARQGLYTTDPNPRVGCVLVKDGNIVGEGWHVRAGEAHAEVHALRQAGDRARAATAYVTLEPCCHQGRTPPCSQTLIQAGVARVIAAMADPNPRVAGQGFAELEMAGISVERGLLQAEAERLNPGFVARMTRGRPFVRVKLASSLDGRTALGNGQSKWITGEPARADVQRLRARSSAILTGIGTVLSDDPSLTVRDIEIGRQPLRVVVDAKLRMPASARMLGLPGKTLVVAGESVTSSSALEARGAEVKNLPGAGDNIDLSALMELLTKREVNELLVEAGATLSGALLKAGLVDEIVVYLAPQILGNRARAMFDFPELADMAGRIAVNIQDIRAIGKDWRMIATVDNSFV